SPVTVWESCCARRKRCLLREAARVELLDLGVLLGGLRESLVEGGQALFHALPGGPPLTQHGLERAGGLTRPRTLQVHQLRVQRGDLALYALRRTLHRACRCEHCFA